MVTEVQLSTLGSVIKTAYELESDTNAYTDAEVVLAAAAVQPSGALGTPSSGTLTNATGLPIATGVSGLAAGIATALATPTSANLKTAVTDETGSGALVFATSPTLVTPALGTPSALVGTNISGTAASLTAGDVTTNANLTGHITSTGNAAILGSFTAAQLSTALSDVTFSGNNSGDQTNITGNAATVTTNANLTGDVTSVGNAATIAANAVTLAKMADMATASLLGRSTAATGDPEVLSATAARTLLNVEDGSTADQSDAEIRTAVEAATDSNVFTDADHSKLGGIEASATADQSNAEIKTAYELNLDTNEFSDAEQTKLAAIEAAADVTDATNVTAAGALMDSEVTNLAQVKAFDTTDYATSAQGTLADSAIQQAALDLAVAGLYDHKGAYNASTNSPDLDTTPSGIKKSDAYTVSVAGTFYAVALEAGDVLIADIDDPVASASWTIVNRNIDSSAFATAAQGSTADSAVQPGDAAHDGFSDFVADEHLPSSTFATSAQGAKADTALQSIAADSITMDMIADVTTDTFLGRVTAETGTVEVLTNAQAKTALDLTGTNSGDQTTIVGITGTKAQFDTAVSDGDVQYVGDAPTAHTIASHSDTTATGAELETLTDNSIADTLHRHSELVASDGSPDPALSVAADGDIGISTTTPISKLSNTGTTWAGGHATDGFVWRSIENDWAAAILGTPAAGVGFGLRLHTLGETSGDYPLFITSGAGSGTAKYTFLGNGNATFAGALTNTGDHTINTGNLVVGTSGKGIDFDPAGSGAAANLLDDYEEGTWTGTLGGGGADPTTPVTATGRYTKTGNRVELDITFSNKDTTGASGQILVAGCPFTSANVATQFIGSCIIHTIATISGTVDPVPILDPNATLIGLLSNNSAAAWSAVNHNAGAGRHLYISISYHV